MPEANPLLSPCSALRYARSLQPRDTTPIMWHSCRRSGAATLTALGVPLPTLALWGLRLDARTLHTF